jgi:lipoprotein-anchoring transpeptidase ErfK/SrfK
MRATASAILTAVTAVACTPALARPAATLLTAEAVNTARFAPLPDPPAKTPSPVILRAEVLLDRARFSPGAIDGLDGDNFRKAVAAYQGTAGLPVSGRLDEPTWTKLVTADGGPVLVPRHITAADAKGPFVKRIPKKMEEQADLDHLGYRDLTEKLSEEVHASPSLLKALNPKSAITEGADLLVPQVVVDRGPPAKVARITVDKPSRAVDAYDAAGKLLAFYPASIGSTEKPAPSGRLTVVHVTHNPDYTYNPDYAFKGVKAKKPFRIAPGPNNPVGSVWIALTGEGYGIHGTPEPDLVGKTQSHGCVRLTNWDVEDLASMVAKNTPVDFVEQPVPASPAPPPVATPVLPTLAAPAPQAAVTNPVPAPAVPSPKAP